MNNNIAIILILVSIGIFYTFTSGQYKEVKRLSEQASRYEGVLESASSIATLRDSLLTNYSSIPRTEIERLEKVLPANVDTMQMALNLDGIAARYGISVKSIKTTTDTAVTDPTILPEYDTSTYKKAVVSFSFIATYQNFKLFLKDIEKSLRLMDINSVSFQSSTAGESGLYEYQVTADTYWLK